jgi:hypothetical protein
MLLRINEAFKIDNPRDYPPTLVEELRTFLSEGVTAHPDPKRRNFYDVKAEDREFFIHVSAKGRVMLLATWLHQSASRPAA